MEGQIDDLMDEIRLREARQERVLVTTLTKRMAEDLTDYLQQNGDQRAGICTTTSTPSSAWSCIRDLRLGEFEVLIGINLLREGLDLAGSLLGGHSGCGQRRIPAQRDLADPDHRPGGPQRRRAK